MIPRKPLPNEIDCLSSLAVDRLDRVLPCLLQVTEATCINPSYFLPWKSSCRPVRFVIDLGCTSKIILQHVFERIAK